MTNPDIVVTIEPTDEGDWKASREGTSLSAYGGTAREAIERLQAVDSLYKTYGEHWITQILTEKSQKYTEAALEAQGYAWGPESIQ